MENDKKNAYSLDRLQKTALTLMTVLALITFVGANLQAVLWQSSDWLVSTVLPATVVKLTNQERSGLHEVPLQRNATLDAAAALKAQDMADHEYFSHFSPTGVSPWHWFKEAGYVYAYAGENLAIHFTDSSEVVSAWMKSPTHRENIVNGQYTEIGVGTAKGSYEGYDTVYVVQLFGTPGQPAQAAASTASEPEVAVVPVNSTAPQVAAAQSQSAQTKPAPTPTPAETTPAETPVVPEQPAPASDPVVVSQPVAATPAEKPIPAAPVEKPAPTAPTTPTPAELLAVDEAVAVAVEEEVVLNPAKEVVIIESPIISTSSGLAVANITVENPAHAGATALASIATKPNTLLQFVYLGLGFVVFLLLTASLVLEAKRLRLVQVAYSVLLLFGMGGLWFLNALLTSGAVIT